MKRKPTNADRIRSRAMTDEELANLFSGGCPPIKYTNKMCAEYYTLGTSGCMACWLEWLKQEAQE